MHICKSILSNPPLSLPPSHYHILICPPSLTRFISSLLPQRLHKKDHELLEPLTSLEESDYKSSDQLKFCEKHMIVDRNNYLLAIEATNAHLRRHGDHDLPCLMEVRGKQLPVSHGVLVFIGNLKSKRGLGGYRLPPFLMRLHSLLVCTV